MKRNPLIVILSTVFIDLLGFSIVIPILAPLLVLPTSTILPNIDQATRTIIFGYLIASYPLAQFIGAPLLGQLSDRYGRRPLLAISLIGTLISRVMFIYGILTANIYILFVSRILDGVTGGNISVAQSAIADITTEENRGKNFGLLGAAFGLGFIIGPYIGGKLGEVNIVNWTLQFLPDWIANSSVLPLWFATLLCAINIVFLYFSFPETLKIQIKSKFSFVTPFKNLVSVFMNANIRVIFVTVFLVTLGMTFFTQFLSVYIANKFEDEIRESVINKVEKNEYSFPIPKELESQPQYVKDLAINKFKTGLLDVLKQDQTQITPEQKSSYEYMASIGLVNAETQSKTSDFFSYIGIWVVIAQGFLTRLLAKRFKSTTLLKAGLLLNLVAVLIFLAPNKMLWLYFIIPFYALSNGLISPNLNALVSNSADAKAQGEVLGGNQAVQSLSQAIPPIISGYITSIALTLPILASAISTGIALLIFATLYRANVKNKITEE